MDLKTVEKRILVLTVAAVLTPVVSLVLRMVLDENIGKYASIWFVVVGVPVVVALASSAARRACTRPDVVSRSS